eukprot:scaffold56874_cov20-Prasinocladus_malaysianus.AAC.1
MEETTAKQVSMRGSLAESAQPGVNASHAKQIQEEPDSQPAMQCSSRDRPLEWTGPLAIAVTVSVVVACVAAAAAQPELDRL